MTENVNKLLLENLLPCHVTNFFIGKNVPNQVIQVYRLYKHTQIKISLLMQTRILPMCLWSPVL